MDNKYLESLVKKGEAQEIAPEVNEEEVVEEITEAVQEPELNEEEDPFEESESNEELAEEPVEEPVKEEPKEEKKPEPKKVDKKLKAADIPAHEKGEMIQVTEIRIFNVPDMKTPCKLYTGNVIVNGMVADMYQIEYMKPGFGLVKGFTSDIK